MKPGPVSIPLSGTGGQADPRKEKVQCAQALLQRKQLQLKATQIRNRAAGAPEAQRLPSYKTARGLRVIELLLPSSEGRKVLTQSVAKAGLELKEKSPPTSVEAEFKEVQYLFNFLGGSPTTGHCWELCVRPRVFSPAIRPQEEKMELEGEVPEEKTAKKAEEDKTVAPKEVTIIIDGEEPKSKRRKASLYTSRDILSSSPPPLHLPLWGAVPIQTEWTLNIAVNVISDFSVVLMDVVVA